MARKPMDPVQLKLRFSEKLRARIEAAALKNGQSMNSEIVQRLEQSFARVNTQDLIQSTATVTATSAVRQLFPAVPKGSRLEVGPDGILRVVPKSPDEGKKT